MPTSIAVLNWDSIADFCSLGLDALAAIEDASGPQQNLFSHGMWPAPHLFSALLKSRRDTDVRWTAVFSHPLSRDPGGAPRMSEPGGGVLHDELAEAFRRTGFAPPETASIFEWAEHVAFAFADRLVFATVEQRDSMLSHPLDAALARAAAAKSSVTSLAIADSSPVPLASAVFAHIDAVDRGHVG